MKTKYIDLVEQTFEWPQEEFQLDKDNLLFHEIPLMDLVEKYGSPLKFTYLPKISQNIKRATAPKARTSAMCWRKLLKTTFTLKLPPLTISI